MIIRNTAYGEEWGLLDPKVLERTKNKPALSDKKAMAYIDLSTINFQNVRDGMGSPNKDLTNSQISEKSILIQCQNRYVPAIVCRPAGEQPTLNACLYLHGGGFIGGNSSTLLNQCRLIAEQANCTVISLDYRLAPETPFPGALHDSREAVEWIVSHREYLGFDSSQIFVAGDSAGGNLAVGCGLLDENHYIKHVISIYGALDLQKISQTLYHWDYSLYEMNKKHKNFIHTRLNKIMYITNLMRPLYIESELVTDPLISPVYAQDFKNLPNITLIEAEFDYFLPSNKYFARLLQKYGKEYQEILYKGLDHDFFDRLGYLEQTKEACLDIARIIKDKGAKI